MAQQGPNIVELYEAAVQQMLPTLEAVTADQLTNATPCVEWNVQNVIIHNIKVADYVQGIIQGNNTTNPMEVGDPLPSQGAREAFVQGTTRVSFGDLSPVLIESQSAVQPTSRFKQIAEQPVYVWLLR